MARKGVVCGFSPAWGVGQGSVPLPVGESQGNRQKNALAIIHSPWQTTARGGVLPYVGSRLASFTLLYVAIMRERLRPLQAVGLGLCLLGLAMLCLPQ